jgi:hypothetical protein
MKRKWTEDTATHYLLKNGFEKPHDKIMIGTCKGLKACSAIDYLTKYHKVYFFI